MNSRSIGIFDSGLGGLSCVSALSRALPGESVIYFGDTARTPYGDKAPDTIRYFTCQVADFLVSQNVKMLVIACNTISALCGELLQQRYPGLPVVDIIRPTVEHICAGPQPEKPLGVIATKATIQSGVYQRLLREKGMTQSIVSRACPLFVPLIESGFRDGIVVESVVKHYLDEMVCDQGIGSLILGCTHYPFIASSIRKLYPQLELIDPSSIITDQIRSILDGEGLLAPGDTRPNHVFYASDLSDTFLDMLRHTGSGDDYSVKFQAFTDVYQK